MHWTHLFGLKGTECFSVNSTKGKHNFVLSAFVTSLLSTFPSFVFSAPSCQLCTFCTLFDPLSYLSPLVQGRPWEWQQWAAYGQGLFPGSLPPGGRHFLWQDHPQRPRLCGHTLKSHELFSGVNHSGLLNHVWSWKCEKAVVILWQFCISSGERNTSAF